MDAMGYGKLVICSSGVFSSKDRIINKINGYIYSSEDYDELTNLIIYILNNKKVIYHIGNKAYKTSLKYNFKPHKKAVNSIIN